MALFQINYFSEALRRITTFNMFSPNDVPEFMRENNKHYERETKTLFLLHGYSGNTIDWMAGSLAQQLAGKYNLAIVMPSGENSFYLDGKGTGKAYGRYIGEEMVNYVCQTFGLSKKKEDMAIGGLSMGGFGAIHTALKYPETFGKAIGLSSALIIHGVKNMKPEEKNDMADYDYYSSVFGELDKLEASENNPETLVKKLKSANEVIPSMYMACGTEDFLIEENRSFRDFLKAQEVDVTYRESAGIHDWDFWNEYLEPSILWMLGEEEESK